jgi:hypothetical protein
MILPLAEWINVYDGAYGVRIINYQRYQAVLTNSYETIRCISSIFIDTFSILFATAIVYSYWHKYIGTDVFYVYELPM